MLNRFLLELDGQGKAASTLRSYHYIIRRWLFSPYPDPVEYLARLDGQLASTTKRHHGRILKGYFRWAVDRGLQPENPLASIRFHAPPAPSVRPFSPVEIDAMLAVATPLDWALVVVLLKMGLRASELVGIEADDIGGDTVMIRKGKGGKTRTLAITPALRLGLLVVSLSHLDYQMLYRRVKAVGRRAGVTQVHPHRFRHTFGCRARESGMDINDLRVLMGHSSIAMTMRYVRFYEEQVAIAAHRRFLEAG